MTSIRAVVEEYLVDHAGLDRDKLADTNRPLKDLGIDSMLVVELVFEAEERFGIRLPQNLGFVDMTLGKFYAMVEQLQAERTAAAPTAV